MANKRWPGPAHNGAERGFLLGDDIPETLEPYINARWDPEFEELGTRILAFSRLDAPAAESLLAALPKPALKLDLSGYAPPAAIVLRVVADHPGTVLAGGWLLSPELPGEAIQVRELTILDPTLVDMAPDVTPAELPAWIEELPADDYAAYLDARADCLEHGITRQAWILAVGRYGVTGARRFPYMRIVTDDETGTRGVWFGW